MVYSQIYLSKLISTLPGGRLEITNPPPFQTAPLKLRRQVKNVENLPITLTEWQMIKVHESKAFAITQIPPKLVLPSAVSKDSCCAVHHVKPQTVQFCPR